MTDRTAALFDFVITSPHLTLLSPGLEGLNIPSADLENISTKLLLNTQPEPGPV